MYERNEHLYLIVVLERVFIDCPGHCYDLLNPCGSETEFRNLILFCRFIYLLLFSLVQNEGMN